MQIQCPSCQGLLEVDDHLGGQVVACGHCEAHIRVPTTTPSAAPRVKAPPPPAPRPRPASAAGRQAEQLGARIRATQSRAAAEAATDPEPRPKKKKKKKRKAIYSGEDYDENLGHVWVGVGAAAFGYVALLGLTFLWHPLFWVMLIAGFVLTTIGRRWFLGIAAEEGVQTWLMCLFVPIYSTYYFFTRLSDTIYPFLVGAVGYLFLITGGLFFIFTGAFADFDRGGGGDFGAPANYDGKLNLVLKEGKLEQRVAGHFHAFDAKQGAASREFVISSEEGTALYGQLPASFTGDWQALAGQSCKVLASSPNHGREAKSELFLDDDDEKGMRVGGGSFEIEAVLGTKDKPVLRGRLTLDIRGQGPVSGTVLLPVELVPLSRDDE